MRWDKYKITLFIYGILFLLSLNLSFADRKRTVADPVSNFFSDLGDLFLDVDRAISVQTSPKVQHEDRIVSQIFRPTNEYLNRLQKNYQTIQTRLGKIIGNTLRPRTDPGRRELPTVSTSSPDKEGQVDATTSDDVRRQTDISTSTEDSSSSSSSDVQEDECSGKPLPNPFEEHDRKVRCARKNRIVTEEEIKKAMDKILLNTRRASEFLIPLGTRAINQLSNDIRRQGDIEFDDSKPEDGIIGDVSYSDTLFDGNFRQFLRDHGRWILDNPLFNVLRQSSEKDSRGMTTEVYIEETETPATDGTPEFTTESGTTGNYVPTSTEYRTVVSKSKSDSPLPPQSSKYYRVTNKDGDVIEEEIDIVLEPESDYIEYVESDDTEPDEIEESEPEPKDSIILAFTPDGVPLKLRLGPEIDNPIGYLHKALRSAGVSLNIPVESYEDLEPVGKEVLRLGSGILMRAVYIDVSNNQELKSLLKTLMKSKSSGKSKF